MILTSLSILNNQDIIHGKYQEAIESFKQAIRIDPDYAEAHCGLGAAYLHSDKNEEAIKSCKQALRIDPDYAYAQFMLGCVYVVIKDRDSALEQYEILKTLDSERANILLKVINE